jgi:hypothetical protein
VVVPIKHLHRKLYCPGPEEVRVIAMTTKQIAGHVRDGALNPDEPQRMAQATLDDLMSRIIWHFNDLAPAWLSMPLIGLSPEVIKLVVRKLKEVGWRVDIGGAYKDMPTIKISEI